MIKVNKTRYKDKKNVMFSIIQGKKILKFKYKKNKNKNKKIKHQPSKTPKLKVEGRTVTDQY